MEPPVEKPIQVDEKADAERAPIIRVYLVLEHRLLRETLVRMLRRRDDLKLAGQSRPAETTAENLANSGCDVVLVDTINPEWLRLAEVQRQSAGKSIKIVAIAMRGEREPFLQALRCGVIGYVLNDASASEVIAALRAAACGEATCPPLMCKTLLQAVEQIQQSQRLKTQRGDERLTLRQQRLMRLVSSGLTNKEIAAELGLSELTVKNHVSRVLKQLDTSNRSKAAEIIRASSGSLLSKRRKLHDRPRL